MDDAEAPVVATVNATVTPACKRCRPDADAAVTDVMVTAEEDTLNEAATTPAKAVACAVPNVATVYPISVALEDT